MTESTQTPKPKHTTKPKKAKTTATATEQQDSIRANEANENAIDFIQTEPEAQHAPEQPQRINDTIKAHQNAIDFIHTAIHRTDCSIQLLTRSGYFSTVQHLQQAKVHLRESERSCRSMIRTIRDGNQ